MAATDDNGVDVGRGQIREGTSLGESHALVKTALQAACIAKLGVQTRWRGMAMPWHWVTKQWVKG